MRHPRLRAALLGLVLVSCAPVSAPAPAPTVVDRVTVPDVEPVEVPWSVQTLPPSLHDPLPEAAQQWIDTTIAGLTLRERVAQMVMIWVLGDYTSTSDSSFILAVERIRRDKVGGVVMSLGSPIEVAEKVNALQRRAEIPLLVSSDVEPGLGRLEGGVFSPGTLAAGSATVLPSNMAIGATRRIEHAREAGRITGEESRAVGIHLAFAPTVDVNNNPANPVINVRSFGEDPLLVSAMGTAFVEGMQESGVAATVKHFPGHGDTDTDSHNALPVVTASPERLYALELVPFRAAIDAGVAAVMSAHIALPAVTNDRTPATLAPEIMTGLLRDSLGFRGLVVTDAMDMRGVGQGYDNATSAVRAVQAGTDILLMPPDVPLAIDAVVAAVEAGTITRERIDASVRRILELKLRTGAIQRPLVSLDSLREVVGRREHREKALEIAADAITLLRDTLAELPLAANRPALVLTYAGENDVLAGRPFVAELRAAIPVTRSVRITPATPRARLDSLLTANGAGEQLVVATFVRTIEGEGRFAIAEPVAKWIDSVAAQRAVHVVAFSSPYVLREIPRVSGFVAAYGRGEAMERAAARAITGRSPMRGVPPTSLPGFFAAGVPYRRPLPAWAAAVTDSVRRVLEQGFRDSVFPGAIAVIGTRTQLVSEVTVGRIDWPDSAAAPDAHTIWDIASLTKVVGMTTAMMQQVERRAIELDAPVQRYLPEFTGPGKAAVTVRHLLTHTSGLPAHRTLWTETETAEEARRLVLATPLDTLPGTRYVYSDLGAMIAGWILERVTGQSLDLYLQAQVFGPLGMVDTRYHPRVEDVARIAPTEVDPWRGRHLRGEVHDENAFRLGGVSAHAGLFSTAADLSRFAQMMLNGGTLGGARIVRPQTIADFTRVQDLAISHRALGWETPNGTNSAGRVLRCPAFGHTGFTGTSFWVDPARDLFVIILTNRVNPSRANSRIGPVRTTIADLAATRAGRGGPAARGCP
ncbi:serine hydrolase [Pseudogemmatithrix spongiicola]|uniref:beta-N-acetylhexosaminidase n=1 Tax=Pseudogemmatithrix spongiicola TaxID=3062599 RepID=A0AA49K0L2_9BACT|nr:serine hydrolase [Gemmatimonadaceae bacterium 'strain 138']WKW15481.1 serine hydrolase [Gemmatimonadaceae bacterium 'strain 318']